MGNKNYPNPAPTFGLKDREMELVQETWKAFRQDLCKNSMLVFTIFFRDYPRNVQYFPFCADIDPTNMVELQAEPLMRLHAIRVLYELSFYVNNMQKPETILHALRQNAFGHQSRAIAKVAYDDLRFSIIKALAQVIGETKFTAEVRSAWERALRKMFYVITDVNTKRKKCNCHKLPGEPDSEEEEDLDAPIKFYGRF